MAQKRMFSLSVVDTDNFLEMPVSARLLYYELGMRADDDGFIDNWKKILSFTGLKEDDLKILIAKQFIIPFESGIIVIKHWRMNNYLRNDRYRETTYQLEKSTLRIDEKTLVYQLNETGIPSGIPSIGKSSIGKNRLDKSSSCSIDKTIKLVDEPKTLSETTTANKQEENLFEFIERVFGRPLGGTEIEFISNWEDNEITRYAIKQAELARVFNIRYIEKILNAYKKENIKNVAEAEEREKRFQESKTTKKSYKSKWEEQKEAEERFLKGDFVE